VGWVGADGVWGRVGPQPGLAQSLAEMGWTEVRRFIGQGLIPSLTGESAAFDAIHVHTHTQNAHYRRDDRLLVSSCSRRRAGACAIASRTQPCRALGICAAYPLADVNHHCSAAATLELCLCLAACSWVVHVRVGQVGAPAHTLIRAY
jgi:hypothetical protein